MILHNFSHFLQRVKERYNLVLNLKDLKEIAETIKSGKARLVRADTRSFHYKLRFNGKLILVVLDRLHSCFITALPINKSTIRTTFSGHKYNYQDALYFSWLLRKFCRRNTSHALRCRRCNNAIVKIDLDKQRVTCENCHNIIKFDEAFSKESLYCINAISKDGFSKCLSLFTDIWWYLYIKRTHLTVDGLKVKAFFYDKDKQYFEIYTKTSSVKVSKGFYSIEQLKEILDDISKQVLSGTK